MRDGERSVAKFSYTNCISPHLLWWVLTIDELHGDVYGAKRGVGCGGAIRAYIEYVLSRKNDAVISLMRGRLCTYKFLFFGSFELDCSFRCFVQSIVLMIECKTNPLDRQPFLHTQTHNRLYWSYHIEVQYFRIHYLPELSMGQGLEASFFIWPGVTSLQGRKHGQLSANFGIRYAGAHDRFDRTDSSEGIRIHEFCEKPIVQS
jgi:hypothetical protein